MDTNKTGNIPLPQKIEWDNTYSVGKKFIDNDHKSLFEIYNQMVDCFHKKDFGEGFAELLSKMTDYSLSHFKNEEEYMKRIGYPGLTSHREQHRRYIKKTAVYNSNFLTHDPPLIIDVIVFLRDWWRDHILKRDIKYELYRRGLITQAIRKRIEELSTEKGKIAGERFFREEVKIIGTKSADVSAISKEIFKELNDKEKNSVFAVCEDLFKGGFLEESFVACDWAYRCRKMFQKEDFKLFEYWVNNYITNWATCDTFCNHTLGAFLDMWPAYITALKSWTQNPNRWVRRASAVALIIPAREGRYKNEIFEIADLLLKDKDDMVQKGYGWMLKECSKPYRQEVFDFVISRRTVMPRTALRYAIEKMPQEMRKEAMKK
jgi:hemerythrin-like metal-binding protein